MCSPCRRRCRLGAVAVVKIDGVIVDHHPIEALTSCEGGRAGAAGSKLMGAGEVPEGPSMDFQWKILPSRWNRGLINLGAADFLGDLLLGEGPKS